MLSSILIICIYKIAERSERLDKGEGENSLT